MRLGVGAGLVLLGTLMNSAALAAQRPALCKLVVEGKAYLDGQCNFEDLGRDGSFAIGVLGDYQPIPAGGFYFAYVDVHGNTADGKWNEDPEEMHANARLGTLTRNGACWANATARVCAWRLRQ